MIPSKRLSQIENRKESENDKGNDFLNGLQLRRIELAITHAIGRHLEAILKKCDDPANYNDLEKRSIPVL